MIPFSFSGSEITKVKLNNVQVICAFVHVKQIYRAFINYIHSLHGIIFILFRLTLVKLSPSLLVSKVSIDLQEKYFPRKRSLARVQTFLRFYSILLILATPATTKISQTRLRMLFSHKKKSGVNQYPLDRGCEMKVKKPLKTPTCRY